MRAPRLASSVLRSEMMVELFEALLEGRMPDDCTRLSASELADLRWDPHCCRAAACKLQREF